MEFIQLLRRASLVALVVGLVAALVVYFFNDWFHDVLQPALGIDSPLGDALGTFLIVVVAFLAQRAFSVVFYKDWMLGLNKRQDEVARRADSYVQAAEQVGKELKQVGTFNDVVRGQLNTITEATEKAAFDITSRLQTIDETITRMSQLVDSSTQETNELVSAAGRRIEQNRQLIQQLTSRSGSTRPRPTSSALPRWSRRRVR